MAILQVTAETLNQHFKGVEIDVADQFVNGFSVDAWECKHCGWTIGSDGLPPPHYCPEDGVDQTPRRKNKPRKPKNP